jgi:predicted transcriptional regulator
MPVTVDVSPDFEAQLVHRAEQAGLSVGAYLERLVRGSDVLETILADWDGEQSPEQMQAKVQRGYEQALRGETFDGETVVAELFAEMDERRGE